MSKTSNAVKLQSVTASGKDSSKDFKQTIQKRRSQELVVGLCGAIGSGVESLEDTLKHKLEVSGYKVIPVKLSDIIIERTSHELRSLHGYERYLQLQNAGDELRNKHRDSILAACAIEEIATQRGELFGAVGEDGEVVDDGELVKTDEKVAYIVNQLKHPDEVALFRTVYAKNFYLVGLIRTEKERKLHLEEEKIDQGKIEKLIRRDRKDSNDHGQQVEKTLYGADYFIRNTHNQSQLLERAVDRFINLVHGVNGITPTIDEIGMHSAFSASFRSACLSRQVGAAILDEQGKVLSTGCNDVPEFGGGLYNANSSSDFRCVHRGQCANDKHKNILKQEIRGLLQDELGLGNPKIEDLVTKITSKTKIKALIEYSRAVHAEMDAIVALARNSSESTKGKSLFATTYPCHNCARHIVAAGIVRVVYIEPYEKSLALKLHDDSITDSNDENKAKFIPFEGVSPNRFEQFFKANGARKSGEEGKVVKNQIHESYHVDSQYLDSYYEFEAKIASLVASEFSE